MVKRRGAMAVPWSQYHGHGDSTRESCIHGQILKGVGDSGKSHLNLPQGTGLSNPVLAIAETNCFTFPKQAENIRFSGSSLCWKCSKAINCCRFFCKASLSMEGFPPRCYCQQWCVSKGFLLPHQVTAWLWLLGHLSIHFFLVENIGGGEGKH